MNRFKLIVYRLYIFLMPQANQKKHLSLLLFLLFNPSSTTAQENHPEQALNSSEQINQFIQSQWNALDCQPAKRCSDTEFVRRVYLDLVGKIPSPVEVKDFLNDERANKREMLVDQLLASEDYVQHFTDIFDTLLMGRTEENTYAERQQNGWRAYLESTVRENRPWNEVAKEILLARPESKEAQGSVWFLYERENKYQEIAEAVAPAFFGIRIECAQCHDHMIVNEIEQRHYWGLVAFFNRGKNQKTKNGLNIGESAVGGFSVFADLSGDSQPNLLTFVDAKTVMEDRPKSDQKQEDKDELYAKTQLDGYPRVPQFSRREQFVKEIVEGHPLVPRAMVNRLWASLLGRGIVHPFDEMDSEHPPSHPELLDFLAKDFVENNYNIKRTIRSIALSDVYQLSSVRPPSVDDPATFAWYLERPLTAEQLARSIQIAVHGSFKNDDPLVGSFRQQFKQVLPDETVVKISDALFLSNNQAFNQFLSDSVEKDHLPAKLLELPSHSARVDLLFKKILNRSPDKLEMAAIEKYLKQREKTIKPAVDQIIWSLLTSAEFRFNH